MAEQPWDTDRKRASLDRITCQVVEVSTDSEGQCHARDVDPSTDEIVTRIIKRQRWEAALADSLAYLEGPLWRREANRPRAEVEQSLLDQPPVAEPVRGKTPRISPELFEELE